MIDVDHDAKMRRAFVQITNQFRGDYPVDLISVSDALPGMASLLAEAYSSTATAVNVEHDSRLVQEGHSGRVARRACQRLIDGLQGGEDVFGAISECSTSLNEATDFSRIDTQIKFDIPEAITQFEQWRAGKRTDVLPTGIYMLDAMIDGFPVGELTTIASQTGAGKTTLMIHIVLAYARRLGDNPDLPPVLVFTIEMNRQQLIERMAANEARVDLSEVKENRATEEEMERYRTALDTLASLPIHVDDHSAPSLDYIMAVSRRIEATEGLGAIYVDYDEKVDGNGDTEELRVGGVAMGLKRVAKMLHVPVISLSQYSRNASLPKWPEDSWLRYSGKKEQESALILHWYWPHYWVNKGVERANIAHYKDERHGYLIVSKNRSGGSGHIDLNFEPAQARFIDTREPA